MMFASKTPRDLNHDPEPFVDQWGIDRSEDADPAGFDFDVRFGYDPRPEFDHVQHNPVNPILAAFREYVVDPRDNGLSWCAGVWLLALQGEAEPVYAEAQRMADEAVLSADPDRDPPREAAEAWTDHARRVLERLGRA